MNTCKCRATSSQADDQAAAAQFAPGRAKSTLLGRMLGLGSWIVPSAILALLPKCPACVVGYIVIGTSVGSSMAGLAQLRLFLIILSAVCLSYAGIRSLSYALTRITRKAQ